MNLKVVSDQDTEKALEFTTIVVRNMLRGMLQIEKVRLLQYV